MTAIVMMVMLVMIIVCVDSSKADNHRKTLIGIIVIIPITVIKTDKTHSNKNANTKME